MSERKRLENIRFWKFYLIGIAAASWDYSHGQCNTKDRQISTGDGEVNNGGSIWRGKVSTQIQCIGMARVMRMHEKGISFAMTTGIWFATTEGSSYKRTYQGERTFSFTCRDLLPWFQPRGRIQKVESRVGYVKLTEKCCVNTETNQTGQGTNWC